jgi:hypothetical protein
MDAAGGDPMPVGFEHFIERIDMRHLVRASKGGVVVDDKY